MNATNTHYKEISPIFQRHHILFEEVDVTQAKARGVSLPVWEDLEAKGIEPNNFVYTSTHHLGHPNKVS